MAKWYVLIDGKEDGPLEAEQLKRFASSGHLKANDKVRREDMKEWHQAKQIKGLFTSAPQNAKPDTARTESKEDDSPQPTDGKRARVFDSYAHAQLSSVWTDLRTLNFWDEVVPIDSKNVGRMFREPVILAVIGAAIAPLVINTLRSDLQPTAFAILFAFVWGLVFRHYVVRANASLAILLSALFFTGIVGTRVAIYLSQIYIDIAMSPNALVSLFGFVFGVGVCEELLKIVPVIVYLIWNRQNADPKTCVLFGVFSGLGFAAFENVHYQGFFIEGTVHQTEILGEAGLREGVQGAMSNVLLRSLSLVFCHALWTGIFAYFVTMAFLSGRRYAALTLTGLATAASIHGVYDWLQSIQPTFAAAVMAGSFVLFYAYLLKLQVLTMNSEIAGQVPA